MQDQQAPVPFQLIVCRYSIRVFIFRDAHICDWLIPCKCPKMNTDVYLSIGLVLVMRIPENGNNTSRTVIHVKGRLNHLNTVKSVPFASSQGRNKFDNGKFRNVKYGNTTTSRNPLSMEKSTLPSPSPKDPLRKLFSQPCSASMAEPTSGRHACIETCKLYPSD